MLKKKTVRLSGDDNEHLASSAKSSNVDFRKESGRSLIKTRKGKGPSILPCGTA